jgi:hypothetical protein
VAFKCAGCALIIAEIPADAEYNEDRKGPNGNSIDKVHAKHRASAMQIDDIVDIATGKQLPAITNTKFHGKTITYKRGRMECDDYDHNPEHVCSTGLHYHTTRVEAINQHLAEMIAMFIREHLLYMLPMNLIALNTDYCLYDDNGNLIATYKITADYIMVQYQFEDDHAKKQMVQHLHNVSGALLFEQRFNKSDEEIFRLQKREDGLFDIHKVDGDDVDDYTTNERHNEVGNFVRKSKTGAIKARLAHDDQGQLHGKYEVYDKTGAVMCSSTYQHGTCTSRVVSGSTRPVSYSFTLDANGVSKEVYYMGNMEITRESAKKHECTFTVMVAGVQEAKFTEDELSKNEEIRMRYTHIMHMFQCSCFLAVQLD